MAEKKQAEAAESTLREDLGTAFDHVMSQKDEDPLAETGETNDEESAEQDKRGPEDGGEELDEATSEEVSGADDDLPDESAADEADGEEVEEAAEADEGDEPEELAPLEHWHREHKEMFKSLPDEAKKFLIDRDKEFQASATKKQMEVSDIKRALEPVKDDLVKHGISDADAVRRLIGAHLRLQENPKESILQLMQSYGINPSDILGVDEEGSETRDSAAMREIEDLKKRLKEYEERTRDEKLSTVAQQVKEFASNHEFFEDVQGEMAVIARSYTSQGQPPPSLEQLYEKACWMNEAVRDKILKRERDKESKKTSANVSKSKRAAQARVKPSRKTSGAKKEMEKKSLREDLSDAFDEAMQAR